MTNKKIIIDDIDVNALNSDEIACMNRYEVARLFVKTVERLVNKEQEYEELRQYHNKCCEENAKKLEEWLDKYNQISRDFHNGKYCNEENCNLLKNKEQELKNICKAFDIEYAIDEETGNLIGRCNKLYKKEQECNKLYIQLEADEEYHKEEENTLRKIIKNKEERNIELYKENNKLKAENDTLFRAIEEVNRINKKLDAENKKLKKAYCEFKNYCTCNIEKFLKTLAEIKKVTEPYKMTIKKICGNCKKYDDCHACCYKDINCYKYTSADTNACEEFTYLDEFVPNILANNILQKISECEVENA